MSVTFTVSIEGALAAARLSEMEAASSDLTPLMDNIGALMEQTTRDRIESTNVAPDGTPWPQSLRASEDGGPTLFDSGRLAASITHIAGRTSVEIGSNLIYAGTHQEGATIVPKSADVLSFRLPNGQFVQVDQVTIPARPFLGLSTEDEQDIDALVEDHYRGSAA